MLKTITIIMVLMTSQAIGQTAITKAVIEDSREATIKVFSMQGNSSGTGFYISNDIIATCFHVIAKVWVDEKQQGNFSIYNDLKAVNENGEVVSLTCISIPDIGSPEPALQDFALLRVIGTVPKKKILSLDSSHKEDIADNVLFSGYPLGTPTMVSHTGTISGITKDRSIICVQASTNKGNSGGALVNSDGKVIGIISMREGGISAGLQNYLSQITATEKQGSVEFMGINPLQATKETISVLDTYISTGIGYARSIKFMTDYIKKKGIKL